MNSYSENTDIIAKKVSIDEIQKNVSKKMEPVGRWSHDEEIALIEMLGKKMTIDEIQKNMGKKIEHIRNKRIQLAVYLLDDHTEEEVKEKLNFTDVKNDNILSSFKYELIRRRNIIKADEMIQEIIGLLKVLPYERLNANQITEEHIEQFLENPPDQTYVNSMRITYDTLFSLLKKLDDLTNYK